MNLAQLHVRRLRGMLSAVREARHCAQAARTHLARAIRVAHAGTARVNREWKKLERFQDNVNVPTAYLEGLTVDPAPLRDWQQELAGVLEEFDRTLTKELEKAKRVAAKPPKPKKRRR